MFDRYTPSGPADPRHSKTARRPSSARRSRSLDVRERSIWTHVWAALLRNGPLVSIPAVEARTTVRARQSGL